MTGISDAQKAALRALGAMEHVALLYHALGAASPTPIAPAHTTPASRLPGSLTSAPPHNLPAALTPFVGRETELAELTRMLHTPEIRLLTIVGAGGMGKTRLVLELARANLETFADGVYFVALAPLASADGLASAIVRALDLTVQGGDLTTRLLRALRDKHMLIVLDNFEHLLDGPWPIGHPGSGQGAGLVIELLQSAPRLRIVATSRERLNVRGEQCYVVQRMAYQPDAMDADAADLAAVRLFAQSAQQVQPQFMLRAAILPDMLRICRLVLGMPLGLELAAAWVEMLLPAEIAAQIAHSVDFLAAGMRDRPERQRSMRAVFDWSWRLLRADEQRILRQLAVFRGQFTIEAAQTVAEAGLPSLLRLVEKSLLRINDGRYEIHELLRQFAAEQLAAAAEQAAVRRRHAAYYLTLAEAMAVTLAGPEQAAALARLEREHDNLRAALAYCLEARDVRLGACDQSDDGPSLKPQASSLIEIGLRLAGALWPFWERYCHLSEGRRWLESFLDDEGAGTVAPEVRAMALIGSGCLAQDQDDYARADALFEEGLRLERMSGRTDRVTRVLAHRGSMVRAQGQYAQATALLEESLALARATGDRAGIAYAQFRLGGVTRERGDYARAANIYEECLAAYRALGDRSREGRVLLGLGDIARDQGDAATAEAYGAESLALGRELGQHWIAGFALNNLELAAIMRGEYAQALPLADEALALFRAQDIHGGIVELLITQGQIACAQDEHERALLALTEGVAQAWTDGPHELAAVGMEELARVAIAQGDAAHAARLCAAASTWRAAMGAPIQPYRRAAYEAILAAARQVLGDDGFATAWAEGAAWRPEQAVAAAIEIASPYRIRL